MTNAYTIDPPLPEDRIANLPVWIGEQGFAALRSPDEDPIDTVLTCARLLRATGLASPDRRTLTKWIKLYLRPDLGALVAESALTDASELVAVLRKFVEVSPAAQAAVAAAAGVESDPEAVDSEVTPHEDWWKQALELRDDLESVCWSLGIAALNAGEADQAEELARWEQRVLEAAKGCDLLGNALETEILQAAQDGPMDDISPWLPQVARASEGCWWLNPLVLPRLQPGSKVLQFLRQYVRPSPPPPESSIYDLPPLRPPPRAVLTPVGAPMDDGGASADPFVADPGPVVAVLFKEEVLIHAIGQGGEEEKGVPPGYLVKHREDNCFRRIVLVTLSPAGGISPSKDDDARAWFVPLAGCGTEPRELRVVLELEGERQEASIRIEPRKESSPTG